MISLMLVALVGCKGGDTALDSGMGSKDGDAGGDVSTAGCVLTVPEELAFDGHVLAELNGAVEHGLTLRNTGKSTCKLDSVQITEGQNYDVEALWVGELAAGGELTLAVQYLPTTGRVDHGTLEVRSSNQDNAVQEVLLVGTGLAPILQVSSLDTVFFDTIPGCSQRATVQLSNSGNIDLVVDSLQFENLGGSITLDLSTAGPLPWTLPPGPSLSLQADFAPRGLAIDSATLTLNSNDPVTPVELVSFTGGADRNGDVVDHFEQGSPKADILFGLNGSGGMSQYASAFEAGVNQLFTELDSAGVDYHLAFVMADDGCPLGGQAFIDDAMSLTEKQDAFDAQNCGGRLLKDCPVSMSMREATLTQFEAALSANNTGMDGCNSGFLRGDASLHLVGFSDESEQSARPYGEYVADFQACKVDSKMLEVSGIGGDYPSGCGHGASAYAGLYEATVATGGSLYSICESDLGPAMADIVLGTKRSVSTFVLGTEPIPETVRVQVDSVTQLSGWSYESGSNIVRFEAGSVPAAGAAVEVAYVPALACE